MTAAQFVPATFPRVDASSALAALTNLDYGLIDSAINVADIDLTADQRNALDEAVATLVATHVGSAMERLELVEQAISAEREAIPDAGSYWNQGARAAFASAVDIVREARS